MQNKTLILAIGLIIVLGLVGLFFYKRSTLNLTQEFQLPQPSILSEEPQPEVSLLPNSTAQPEAVTEETTQTTTEKIASETKQIFQPEAQNIVTYTDSGYSPRTLKVKVGETVTFKNQSLQAMWPASDFHPTHRVYSGTSLQEHCPDTTGTAFDACTEIQPGDSWSFTFNKQGTWKYHDHLSPSHTGTIIVE